MAFVPCNALAAVRLTFRSWNTTLTREDTAALGPKVDEVDRKLFELSTNLEVKLEALTLLASSTGSENQVNSLQRLKDTVRSAATVLSAASTVADPYVNRNSSALSEFSVAPWEPNDQFRQWIATSVGLPGFIQAPDTHSSSLTRIEDTPEPFPYEPLSRTPPDRPVTRRELISSGDPTRLPPDIPNQYIQQAPPRPPIRGPPDPPVRHVEPQTPFEEVRVVQSLEIPGTVDSQQPGHVRSSSAPTAGASTALNLIPPSRRWQFWGRTRPNQTSTYLDVKANLVVHEPPLHVANLLFENNDRFQLTEVFAQARLSMDVSKVPLPSTRNGKTLLKAVYVGDGACGKTCAIMYVTLMDQDNDCSRR